MTKYKINYPKNNKIQKRNNNLCRAQLKIKKKIN